MNIFLHFLDIWLLYKKRKMPTVGREASAVTGSEVAHTAVAENVAVKSFVKTQTESKVSMENAEKMTALMSKLGKKIFSHFDMLC